MQDFLKKARERPELTAGHDVFASTHSCGRTSTATDAASGIPVQDVYSAIQAAIRITHGQPVQPVLQCLVVVVRSMRHFGRTLRI